MALLWAYHIHFILKGLKTAFVLCGHRIILFANLWNSNLVGVSVKSDRESLTELDMLNDVLGTRKGFSTLDVWYSYGSRLVQLQLY